MGLTKREVLSQFPASALKQLADWLAQKHVRFEKRERSGWIKQDYVEEFATWLSSDDAAALAEVTVQGWG